MWLDYNRIMGEGKENMEAGARGQGKKIGIRGQGPEVSKCIEGLTLECLDMPREVQIIL
jgi:hypothetical protein